MQTIHTKNRGDHTFRKTWVSSDGRHIGVLAKGGYAYLSGLLVDSKQDLMDLITEPKELEKALAWWDNKDVELEEKEYKRVILDTDGEFKWEDGSPITSAQSLVENLPRGDKLDLMLAWFHEREHKKAEDESAEKEIEKALTAENVEKAEKKKKGRSKKE